MDFRKLVIHHCSDILWHRDRVGLFAEGLMRLGITVELTESRTRISGGPAVLFGTTLFKEIEASPGDWLLVDRACWGDPDCVRLGWNGHGLDADYKVPDPIRDRHIPEVKKHQRGNQIILFGDYDSIPDYRATHYIPHPANGTNPTGLPIGDVAQCRYAVVGKSTVAVELMLKGVEVKITDPSNMANRSLEYIANTQWSWDEIQQGKPIRHLFDG